MVKMRVHARACMNMRAQEARCQSGVVRVVHCADMVGDGAKWMSLSVFGLTLAKMEVH